MESIGYSQEINYLTQFARTEGVEFFFIYPEINTLSFWKWRLMFRERWPSNVRADPVHMAHEVHARSTRCRRTAGSPTGAHKHPQPLHNSGVDSL